MALMQAGLATMAGTSPNAFANIGEGASKGLSAYGESKKAISARADKLDDLRSKIEESQRAEALAAVKYGSESAERRRLSDHTDKLKGAEAQLKYNEDVAKHGIDKEKNDIDRLNVESDAAYKSGHLSLEKEKLAQLKATNASGMSKENERAAKVLEFKIKNLDADMENDTRPGATEYYRKIKAGYINDLNKLYGDTGGGYVPYSPPAQPVKGPDFMDRVMHPIDAWNGNLPGQNTETPSAIKLPSGATVKRVG
jgi:hypothetical protein